MNMLVELWIGVGIIFTILIGESIYYRWQNNKQQGLHIQYMHPDWSRLAIGTIVFGVGAFLTTHHGHNAVHHDRASETKEIIMYYVIGVGLVTVGSNILTDLATDKLRI